MATINELMAHGLPPSVARGLGQDTPITGLVATGTNQAGALALLSSISVFSTVAAGTGALLPVSLNKPTLSILNNGANALTVYPNGSDTVNGGSSVSIPAGKSAVFIQFEGGWVVNVSA